MPRKLSLTRTASFCLAALSWAGQARPFDCAGVEPAGGTEVRARLITSSLAAPVDVGAPAGDVSRLFVVEQAGRIRMVRLSDDALLPAIYLDIRGRIDYGGERGLLGLTFHPDYAQNGFFFVYYTRPDGDITVSRFRAPDPGADPPVADPASEKVLLTIEHSTYGNHNGGQLAFGPLDGYLYLGTGDGGSGGDPFNSGQTGQSLLGKILRIDVDAGDPYGIPAGNPFAASGDGVRDEVWALGVRNPWRFSFDPQNGDLYIADVGQNLWEEINYQPGSSPGGLNYEWKVREGDHAFSGTAYGAGTRVKPILEYPHSGGAMVGRSITGGVVYRGCRMPELHGVYFFADYNNNWVRSFRVVDGQVADLRDRTAELNRGITADALDDISAFGVDGRGEIYICDLQTKLFRIVPANPGPVVRGFRRGDGNGDQVLDLSDAVFALIHLFAGGSPGAVCQDAMDSNDDGALDVSDPVYFLDGLFRGGPLPQPPTACGQDPTADPLDCAATSCIQGA